jgi:RNA polymerase sigma-70 factor (ECF subfamily)
VDQLRGRARLSFWEIELTPEHEATLAAEVVTFESRDAARRLRAAVAALPIVQRQAIELLKFEQMSLSEAATTAGRSEGSLKVAVHRAAKALRVALAERHVDPAATNSRI